MASRCQLALCHVIVVKRGCNNRNNMFLAQFKPLLRCSFYLKEGGARIYVSLRVSVCHSSCVSFSFQPCLWQTRCLWKGCSYLHPDVLFGCREKAPKVVSEHQKGFWTPDMPPLALRAAWCLGCGWLQVCKKALEHQDGVYERRGVAQPQVFPSNFPACLAVRK